MEKDKPDKIFRDITDIDSRGSMRTARLLRRSLDVPTKSLSDILSVKEIPCSLDLIYDIKNLSQIGGDQVNIRLAYNMLKELRQSTKDAMNKMGQGDINDALIDIAEIGHKQKKIMEILFSNNDISSCFTYNSAELLELETISTHPGFGELKLSINNELVYIDKDEELVVWIENSITDDTNTRFPYSVWDEFIKTKHTPEDVDENK